MGYTLSQFSSFHCELITVLRTFAPIVSAHPYCARESHATSCHVMPRHASSAHAKYENEQMIRQMAIATALLGIYDLGCPVTPTFLFRNRLYLQLTTHCPKMNKKVNVGSYKQFKICAHGTWILLILRLQGAVKLWSLNANLFFEEPH